MARWTVTTPDGIEDVGADYLDIEGGALVFSDGNEDDCSFTVTVAYAPNRWLTVTRDED